jgi:hypothetical protein
VEKYTTTDKVDNTVNIILSAYFLSQIIARENCDEINTPPSGINEKCKFFVAAKMIL